MVSFSRNVPELDADNRRSLVNQNHSQQEQPVSTANGDTGPQLPDWCNVYDGLSDEEVADLEKTILNRADLARSFD